MHLLGQMGPHQIQICVPAPALWWAWETLRGCPSGPLPFDSVLRAQNDEFRRARRQAEIDAAADLPPLPLPAVHARSATGALRTVTPRQAAEAYSRSGRPARLIDQIA